MVEHTTSSDNTEEKIRTVAKKLFTEKGYAGTTIRDVAEEAGVNVALLNYYFRSKDKLFKAIFMENFQEYSEKMFTILFEENLSLEKRIRHFINEITDQLKKNPDLPIFVMTEMRQNTSMFQGKIKLFRERLENSQMVKQLHEEEAKGNIRKIDPLHLHFIITSQVTAPFLSAPLLQMNGLEGEKWDQFLEERKTIIADMIMAYLRKIE